MVRQASWLGVLSLLCAACGEGGGSESQVVEAWDDFLARHELKLCEVVPYGVEAASTDMSLTRQSKFLERARVGAFHEGDHFYCVSGAYPGNTLGFALGRDAEAFRAWASRKPEETLWVAYVEGAYVELPDAWRTTTEFHDGWFVLRPWVKAHLAH